MQVAVLASLLLVGSSAHNPKDDVQYMNIQSVKGGGGFHYTGRINQNRFFNNTQHGYGVVNHTTVNHGVGVCYVEVPTATLVRDPKHIPAGNGSRPDLSRIRTCCAGYIRNIHNYQICDPVCTTECVNALCTAPNTCTCFPDHVKNSAGFCVATCPIGCQNGHCSGGECLCKEGFKLDVDGRFCVPSCRDNCGGVGNCTAPNTCACNQGYSSTPDGSCRPGTGSLTVSYPQPGSPGTHPQQCGSCINGYCVGTECRCQQGYLIYKGECKALCNPNCGPNAECVAPNVCAAKASLGINATQPHTSHPYPNSPQYPYPNQPQNTTYQNPSQYPNGQYPQNQYPYPNSPPNQYPHPNSQSPNQYPGNHPQNNTHQQYPYSPNQYPGTPYNQQNHFSGQPDYHPYHNQPNGTYPNQSQYPHQNLYPILHTNNNTQISEGKVNGTGGQVFYQNHQYNPLENITFNLQQGRTEEGKNVTQGQSYGGGQYSQGQYGHGQTGQGQYGQGQTGQGQYGQGQYSQGQYSHGENSQGQFSQGQTSQGQFNQGQTSQGQYGQGQAGHGQFEQGQVSQGQYGQGQYSQGQYGHGQYSQGQYGQGQYQYGYNPGGYPVPYGQSAPQGQQGAQTGPGVPHCEQPCINGYCVAPNTCQCFTGYNQDPADPTGVRCVPHCPGGCINGYCSSPNNCMCLSGYEKDFSVKGRSSCIRRVRRSVEDKPVDVSDLLVFEISNDE